MHNAGEDQAAPARRVVPPSLALELAMFFLGWLVIIPLVVIITPFGAFEWWWRVRRMRRFYKKMNRLVRWDKTGHLLAPDNGTLLIEVYLLEHPRHVWWLHGNLRDKYAEFPLAPASILQPSFKIEERLKMLTDEVTKAWWDAHLQQLEDGVCLVQMPLGAWRHRGEILKMPNAVAVDSHWTHSFREQRT